jgi:hypothetical protein
MQRLEELFNNKMQLNIFKDMYYLSANLYVYSHFTSLVMEDDNLNIKNYAQYFICKNSIKNLTLGLGVLFTKKEKSGKKTGYNFLNSIFDKVKETAEIKSEIELFNGLKKNVYKIYSEKLKIFRNKRYAHLDSDFHILSSELKQIEEQDLCEIRKLCGLIQYICEYILNINSSQKTVFNTLGNSGQLLELYNKAENISYGQI